MLSWILQRIQQKCTCSTRSVFADGFCQLLLTSTLMVLDGPLKTCHWLAMARLQSGQDTPKFPLGGHLDHPQRKTGAPRGICWVDRLHGEEEKKARRFPWPSIFRPRDLRDF